MEGNIFVGIIEDWLKGLTKKPKSAEKVELSSLETSDTPLLPEDFQRFKSWFLLALRVTDVWSGERSMKPEDVVFRSAVKRTHAKLLEALSMFSDKELLDIFGSERADKIRGVANEVSIGSISYVTLSAKSSDISSVSL